MTDINLPRLDRKIAAAKRRAEDERKAMSPPLTGREAPFEKGDHKTDGTVESTKPGTVKGDHWTRWQ